MTDNATERIIGIDPGTRFLGVAVLEGERLLRYGVIKNTRPESVFEIHRKLSRLLWMYSPIAIVVEKPFYPQAVRNAELKRITDGILKWAAANDLATFSFTPAAVKACFGKKNKRALAEEMTKLYPFLLRYLDCGIDRRKYWYRSFDAIALSLMCVRWYASISNPPAPLRISHSPLSTPAAETSSVTPSPVATTSQPATPNPVPAIIPGLRPSDWVTYKNDAWQFEMKIPPNWTAEQVGPGLVISGDSAAIRIDTEGVGPNEGATSAPAIATKMIAGQQVQEYPLFIMPPFASAGKILHQ